MKTYEQMLDESWARSRALDRLAIRWMLYMMVSGIAGYFANETHWAFGIVSLAATIVCGTRLNRIGDATQWEYRYASEIASRMLVENLMRLREAQ